MERLTTREELQGAPNDIAAKAQNIVQLKQSHDNLDTHIYRLFLPVSLGISILLHLLKFVSIDSEPYHNFFRFQ
jgi:hypothetical protein